MRVPQGNIAVIKGAPGHPWLSAFPHQGQGFSFEFSLHSLHIPGIAVAIIIGYIVPDIPSGRPQLQAVPGQQAVGPCSKSFFQAIHQHLPHGSLTEIPVSHHPDTLFPVIYEYGINGGGVSFIISASLPKPGRVKQTIGAHDNIAPDQRIPGRVLSFQQRNKKNEKKKETQVYMLHSIDYS